MNFNSGKSRYLTFNSLLTLLISILISGILTSEHLQFNLKYKTLKQHTEENFLNIARQDNTQLLTKIIQSFYLNNSSFTPEVNQLPGLKLNEEFIICLNRINKYPRWSKSTFS